MQWEEPTSFGYDGVGMRALKEFHPSWLLCNPHLMTLVPRYWPRPRWKVQPVPRLFTTAPATQLLGMCHWQAVPAGAPTVLLVHGLEGSADSHYMRGMAVKAFQAGCNVIRMNQRTCGGTEHLTPTLYNSGLSDDYRAIVRELAGTDGLPRIWLVGYSMGGNLLLKAAGEIGRSEPALAGVVAVSPNIDPTPCVAALETPRNWLYHAHFLSGLKARIRRKAALFPEQWDLSALRAIKTISQFDDVYTARDAGCRNAADYYDRAGARHVLHNLSVPTLIIAAQDDPFIPAALFETPEIRSHKSITTALLRFGGHCGFFQRYTQREDRFWAENRIIEWLALQG
ncbi:MAG: alpha/beta fold hydrolase [Nitrospira sp.]|nr:alpha/beta fold hydrolase [Nitrospira sp.]